MDKLNIALATAPFIEKVVIGVVILICIILLIVGLSLLHGGSYWSGFLCTLLGVGGIGGSIYWLMHPASSSLPANLPGKIGRDEDDNVRDMPDCECNGGDDDDDDDDLDSKDGADSDSDSDSETEGGEEEGEEAAKGEDFEELEEQIDYIETEPAEPAPTAPAAPLVAAEVPMIKPEDAAEVPLLPEMKAPVPPKPQQSKPSQSGKKKKRSPGGHKKKGKKKRGGHEAAMLDDLDRMVKVLETGVDNGTLGTVSDSLSSKASKAMSDMKLINDVLDRGEKEAKLLNAAFKKLDDQKQKQVLDIISNLRTLSNQMGTSSLEMEGRISKLEGALRG